VSELSKIHGRVAILSRHRQSNDPELAQAKADLAEARVRELIQRETSKAPPLTTDQRSRLAVLLLAPSDQEVA
jgi:hypothetical protein